jgi:hypothetical protein
MGGIRRKSPRLHPLIKTPLSAISTSVPTQNGTFASEAQLSLFLKRSEASSESIRGSRLSSLSLFIDENKRTIAWGFYVLAGAGFLKIFHSIQAGLSSSFKN